MTLKAVLNLFFHPKNIKIYLEIIKIKKLVNYRFNFLVPMTCKNNNKPTAGAGPF